MPKRILTGLSSKLFEWILKFKGIKTSPDTLAQLEVFLEDDLPDPFPHPGSEHVVTGSPGAFKVLRIQKQPPMVILLDTTSETEYPIELNLFDSIFSPAPAKDSDKTK